LLILCEARKHDEVPDLCLAGQPVLPEIGLDIETIVAIQRLPPYGVSGDKGIKVVDLGADIVD
jgi:hypothetical protein